MEEKRQVIEDGDEGVALGHMVQGRGRLDRDIPLLWEGEGRREERGGVGRRGLCSKGGEGSKVEERERESHTPLLSVRHTSTTLCSLRTADYSSEPGSK